MPRQLCCGVRRRSLTPGQAVFSGKRIDLGANVDLIPFCEKQYIKLKLLIDECESKFKGN
jgi:hypothetical protein